MGEKTMHEIAMADRRRQELGIIGRMRDKLSKPASAGIGLGIGFSLVCTGQSVINTGADPEVCIYGLLLSMAAVGLGRNYNKKWVIRSSAAGALIGVASSFCLSAQNPPEGSVRLDHKTGQVVVRRACVESPDVLKRVCVSRPGGHASVLS